MNKVLLTALLAIVFTFGTAISNEKAQNLEQVRNRITNKLLSYTSENFIEHTKRLHERKNNDKFKEFVNRNPDVIQGTNPKPIDSPQSLVEIAEMPANSSVPAEFEELQAVLITWNYYSFDVDEVIDEPIEPLFEGIGLYYDYFKQTVKLVDIVSFVDIYDESPYSMIFANVANAIQQEVPVWINIWHPDDSTEIKDFMQRKGMPLVNYKFFINPGNSFWYRDAGPVAFYYGDDDEIGFINFEYYGYRPLDDEIPLQIGNKMGYPVYSTTIEFEGGNILVDGDGSLFTTSAVASLNADNEGKVYRDPQSVYGFSVVEKKPLTLEQVRDSLKRVMNLKNVRILPALRNDGGTGHIDLYADLFDENTFVFSQMPQALQHFADYATTRRNIDTLVSLNTRNSRNYLKRYIPFPRRDNGTWYTSAANYERYTRTYSNHTFVNRSIIQPVFNDGVTGDVAGDNASLEEIRKAYPGYNIIPIDVRAFDGFGGAIHCITKQIPAENPIRIFHYPLQSNDIENNYFPFNCEIRNQSGIKSANVFWRNKGDSEWSKIELQERTDAKFYVQIPGKDNAVEETIEYYIEATSNNGKTITKPMTAPNGFYSVTYGTSTSADDFIASNIGEFFPNPANEFSSIEFVDNNSRFLYLKIFDLSGKVLYSNKFDVNSSYDIITLNTSLLQTGSYIVRFELENGSVQTRRLNVVR